MISFHTILQRPPFLWFSFPRAPPARSWVHKYEYILTLQKVECYAPAISPSRPTCYFSFPAQGPCLDSFSVLLTSGFMLKNRRGKVRRALAGFPKVPLVTLSYYALLAVLIVVSFLYLLFMAYSVVLSLDISLYPSIPEVINSLLWKLLRYLVRVLPAGILRI